MPKTAALRLQDHRAILALANTCRELGDDNQSWRAYYLEGLARLVDADAALGGELCGIASGQPRTLSGGASDWRFENGLYRTGPRRAVELFDSDPTNSSLIRSYFGSGALQRG